jgi:hypothetical protein
MSEVSTLAREFGMPEEMQDRLMEAARLWTDIARELRRAHEAAVVAERGWPR